jgi:hypothetical protein
MTPFIGYTSNAVLNSPIYFNSHVRIVWQIKDIIPMRCHVQLMDISIRHPPFYAIYFI